MDLGGGQAFAIESDFHLEIEQRVLAESRRRLTTDLRGHLRARRTVSPPGRGHPNHPPGFFRLWDVSQELNAFLGRPPEWVEDLPGTDEGLQPRESPRRALHRKE